jgi:2-methylcitrate dehydratase PrpD
VTVAQKVADYIFRTKYGDIPPEILKQARQCILDCIGVALYGSTFEASRIALAVIGDPGIPRGGASIFGTCVKTVPHLAAFANAVMAHVADFDDSMLSLKGHPSSVLLPAALAAAEKVDGTGKDLLTAFVVGTEVAGKIGQAMGWSHYEIGWHSTGTVGAIAASAAVSKALKLDRNRVCNALGIAVSSASGLRINFGTMTKSYHAAHAAMAGVLTAQLAERGFDASSIALEGAMGFGKLFGAPGELSSAMEALGKNYALDGIIRKPYPSCAGTLPPVEAILKMREQSAIRPGEIKDIEVEARPVMANVLIHHDPHTPLEAKFSMEFCLAAALVFGRLGIAEFAENRLFDPAVRALIKKVTMISSEAMERLSAEQGALAPTRLKVKLQDGRELEETISEARGGPSNPMSDDELREKFRECGRQALPEGEVERLLEVIEDLENVNDLSLLAGCIAR